MKIRKTYKNKEYIFISLLGINISNGEFSKLGVCDEECMQYTIDKILEYNTQTIVLDCTSMVYRDDQKTFEKFTTHPQLRDREILFINPRIRLLTRLQNDLDSNKTKYEINKFDDNYFSNQIVQILSINHNFNLTVKKFIINTLKQNDADILRSCCDDHCKHGYRLPSTSLWTNYYIEIASILKKNPIAICWLISRLCNKFRDRIPKKSNVLIACTSLNSTIITSMVKESLSDSYDVDVICFDRLGPDLTINEHSLTKQSKYETVLYLCDFIVGGTEFKILKALLSLRKIDITDIIAIGSFKDFNETKIDNIPFDRIFHMPQVIPNLKYGLTKEKVI